MRQIILDLETTGLNVKDGHKIVEIACLEVIDRKLTGNKLHLYINPQRVIPEEVIKIHGITNDKVKNEKKFNQVSDIVIDFIKDSTIIAHNAKFDIGFLDYQLQECGHKGIYTYIKNVIDTMELARRRKIKGRINLNALCDYYKIDRSNRILHGALLDCELLYDIYINLTQEQLSIFKDEPLKEVIYDKVDVSGLKVIKATYIELAIHDIYMMNLKG